MTDDRQIAPEFRHLFPASVGDPDARVIVSTTPEQDVTIEAIRSHHGVATVRRGQDGEVVVVVPQDRSFKVMLSGDAVDLEENRMIPKEEVQEYGC